MFCCSEGQCFFRSRAGRTTVLGRVQKIPGRGQKFRGRAASPGSNIPRSSWGDFNVPPKEGEQYILLNMDTSCQQELLSVMVVVNLGGTEKQSSQRSQAAGRLRVLIHLMSMTMDSLHTIRSFLVSSSALHDRLQGFKAVFWGDFGQKIGRDASVSKSNQ